ncbi:hypothetical protein [Hydrogenophaga crocea]|uniref:Uncharacterized protein n=1 Tax=Hydrogenophaga crocea TaxID=2716225 RepID=A0A6G8INC6_9BURK|nr:hypothetical protein [Hydrogenophaga crocea]QIM54535.1 hypothetical protein G9Q37_21375 [Hydrogenophaga crocea]
MLRATMVEHVANADPSKKWPGRWLEVVDTDEAPQESRWQLCVPRFRLMCDAIMSDIQNAKGSGAMTMEAIRRVERAESFAEELGGNAWYTYITPSRVWFEGQYEQGEGGAVSLDQFKLAVDTYVRFLSDPEHKTIEVPFPAE